MFNSLYFALPEVKKVAAITVVKRCCFFFCFFLCLRQEN